VPEELVRHLLVAGRPELHPKVETP
jgi:hypothetical protein